MPIYKGNTPIVGIYKGSTEIVRRYRGADLIYESAKWLPYSFSPFILTTLPQTIDGLNVKDAQKITSLKGNSVAWNQLLTGNGTTETKNGITFTHNGDGTITVNGTATATADHYFTGSGLLANHKYLLKGCPNGGSASTYSLYCGGNLYDRGNGIISTITSNQSPSCRIEIISGTTVNNLVFKPQLFDLTLMFGPGNEPTTVLEFNRLFPKHYAYDAGTLKSSQASALKTTGYNQCDNQFEIGYINYGSDLSLNYCVRTPSSKAIKVIAGQTYTFSVDDTRYKYAYIAEYDEGMNFIKQTGGTNHTSTTATLSDRTHYIRLVYGDKDNTQITTIPDASVSQACLHLTGKTGYEPYWSETYQLPNVVLRSAGSVSDELSPEGTLTRRIGVVDLGTLNWSLASNGYFTTNISDMKLGAINSTLNNAICSKYQVYSNLDRGSYTDKGINYGYDGGSFSIRAKDTSISTDNPTAFKTAMSGVYLYYELATPTTEQSTAFQEKTRIDPYGTMEITTDIPQGIDSRLKCK